MIVNKFKMQLALATACMNPYDLCKKADIRYATYRRIMLGNDCKPVTIGKVAKALGVPVQELLQDEAG